MKTVMSVGIDTPTKRSSKPRAAGGGGGSDARSNLLEPIPAGFRRLSWTAVTAVFLLVILGGVVRVSDSGLGCGPAGSGTHGWPLCNGRLVPGLDVNHVLEYSHRIVAGISSLLIIALVLWAWRRLTAETAIKRLTAAALGLVVFEAVLGGATVEYDLHELLVAVHLGTAMIILALLLAAARAASRSTTAGLWPSGIKRLAVATSVSVWATIVAGGYMSGTQAYGRDAADQTFGARLACGAEFPGCLGGWFPFGRSEMTDVHLAHRALMYVTAILVLTLAALVLRHARARGDRLGRWALVATGVLGLQILLGALNVVLDKSGWLIIAHLATGTILWIVAVSLTISVTGRPRAQGPPVRPT